MKSRRKSRNLRLVKITYVRKNTRVFPNVRVYLAHRGHTSSTKNYVSKGDVPRATSHQYIFRKKMRGLIQFHRHC